MPRVPRRLLPRSVPLWPREPGAWGRPSVPLAPQRHRPRHAWVGGHGIHRVRAGHPVEGRAGCLKVLGGDAVGDDAEDGGVVVVEVVDGELHGAADLGGGEAEPRRDEEHGGAEVGGDRLVRAVLRRPGHERGGSRVGGSHLAQQLVQVRYPGIVAALDRPLGYEIINLGRGEPVLLRNFVRIMEELSGRKANLAPMPRLAADFVRNEADISKARRLLAYDPQVSVAEGVRRFWEWYREHDSAKN